MQRLLSRGEDELQALDASGQRAPLIFERLNPRGHRLMVETGAGVPGYNPDHLAAIAAPYIVAHLLSPFGVRPFVAIIPAAAFNPCAVPSQ